MFRSEISFGFRLYQEPSERERERARAGARASERSELGESYHWLPLVARWVGRELLC